MCIPSDDGVLAPHERINPYMTIEVDIRTACRV